MFLRIGIDFDNTLACYDSIFVHLARECGLIGTGETASKQGIHTLASQQENGERIWQQMQGMAYGLHMPKAVQFEGEEAFLLRCAASPGIEIFIVSHKTELGHFDKTRTNLREAARYWMKDKGFFNPDKYAIPEANLFFESTQQEKVARIIALNCDIFIDDLAEIFMRSDFPKTTRKILFTNGEDRNHYGVTDEVCAHWADIEASIFDS